MRKRFHLAVLAFCAAFCAAGATEIKNGASYTWTDVKEEMVARVPKGAVLRFFLPLEDGCAWQASFPSRECAVTLETRPRGICGAPASTAVMLEKKAAAQAPALVELAYVRRGAQTGKKLRVVVYTVSPAAGDFHYPPHAILAALKAECAARGIVLVDWHVHMRGGFTPEMAKRREEKSGILHSAMENYGREWEIYDNARLSAFADAARRAAPGMPVGIQVNDRDWHERIDAATRAKFDYILADTMIMGTWPDGRAKRLWTVTSADDLGDAEAWMDAYVAHTLRILDEPISILANPMYLPAPFAPHHRRLWTPARMKAVIAKAVAKGVAIEIQAGSPWPTPPFLKMAKEMGAKFSFGTNNFDGVPKDLTRWLDAIVWLDLKGTDIWTPDCLAK